MLGINGTDDPRHLIEKFQSSLELEQPLLLEGGEVAIRHYAVRGYPAHFWIDREGRIAEYSNALGRPAALAEKLEKMLK